MNHLNFFYLKTEYIIQMIFLSIKLYFGLVITFSKSFLLYIIYTASGKINLISNKTAASSFINIHTSN